MENKEVQVRLMVLSTDHEDMEGYEKALRTLFEENVVSINYFDWAVKHPRPPVELGRENRREFGESNRDPNAFTVRLGVPATMAATLSVFQEQLTNTTLRRDQFDQDKRKSFTLALYEVIPDNSVAELSIGRIKVISNCFFPEIGIGFGQVREPQPAVERERQHGQQSEWKTKPAKSDRPAAEEGRTHFEVGGRELIANDKAREAVFNHAFGNHATAVNKKNSGKAAAKK